ncbi:extracellular solute-binding protein, partial [Glycomyces tenuis]
MVEITRRNFLGAIGVGAGGLAAGGTLAGCTGSGTAGESGTDFAMPTFQAAPELEIEPFHTSDTPGMQNVYTEQVTTFFKSVDREPGSGGTVTSFQLTWGEPSDPLEENQYWQELNERLGVSFEPTFVPQPTFDQKFSTMLASGEVPDLVFVNDQSAVNLQGIRDGAFADLSDVLAGDNILEWPNLAARKEEIWRASLKDGRIYQVPSTVWAITSLIAMRTDLLEQTGIGTAPTDADQLLTVLREVTALGTGPGGQPVYGVSKYDPPMWRWIFKTGPDWRLGDDGGLVFVAQTEEYRQMLTWLANAWDEGVFDPVAMTANPADIVSGSGLQYRSVTDSFTALGFTQNEMDTPGAKMDFFDVPGYDGTAPVITRNVPYGRSTCVSAAAAEDEDRLVEILNVLDYLSAPYGSEEALFIGSGIEG